MTDCIHPTNAKLAVVVSERMGKAACGFQFGLKWVVLIPWTFSWPIRPTRDLPWWVPRAPGEPGYGEFRGANNRKTPLCGFAFPPTQFGGFQCWAYSINPPLVVQLWVQIWDGISVRTHAAMDESNWSPTKQLHSSMVIGGTRPSWGI